MSHQPPNANKSAVATGTPTLSIKPATSLAVSMLIAVQTFVERKQDEIDPVK